jgi:hypothetical protein
MAAASPLAAIISMKIQVDAVIPDEKLTKYLLVPRPWDDKSRYLGQAGFPSANFEDLRAAIRAATATSEAVSDGGNEYGEFLRVECLLHGPNGLPLPVVLIWLRWYVDGTIHFVTLKPNRG